MPCDDDPVAVGGADGLATLAARRNSPIGHTLQLEAPNWMAVNEPDGHAVHVLASIIVENVPDAHRLHAPSEEYAPIVHELHTDEPVPLVDDPAWQVVHSVEAVLAANVPI